MAAANDAHPDDDREHRLLVAVRRDDVAAVARLLPEKLRNAGPQPLPSARGGATVLHLARSAAMVDALFEHGGDAVRALANAAPARHPWKVPLCAARNAGVVRALLARGAGPDGAPRHYARGGASGAGAPRLTHAGQTPLMEAAGRLDDDSVALLLAAGANPALVNAFGNSAADRAWASLHFSSSSSSEGAGGFEGGAGAAGPSGVGAATAVPPQHQQQHDQENDDDDGESDSDGESEGDEPPPPLPPPAEARARFARTLMLLLRAGGGMRKGYLCESLPVIARAAAAAGRAAAAELARRRDDPRLAARAREELAALADDFAARGRAGAALAASRARLRELEAESAARGLKVEEGEEDDEEEEEEKEEEEGGGGGGGGGE